MAKKDDAKLEINANFDVNDLKEWCKDKGKKSKNSSAGGAGGAVYGMGFIGALVYWMQAAVGFGAVITGFLKSIVWPAYIIYKLLESFYS